MTDRQGRNQTMSDFVSSPASDRHGHTPIGVSVCPEDRGYQGAVEMILYAARSVVITGLAGASLIPRVLPEGAGSKGLARPCHITRHNFFRLGNC